ncbi:uncharacterized protein LOC129749550 [Uranotaenia lowii]|uniref:uncharacterized protein LOC129749550 n=1 Tax=Uranotaenia lowii TaxID=190385 RepID=UPI00247B06C5|nr:uncharacterized protein LOC129749550 [Uranotaenia lowii]
MNNPKPAGNQSAGETSRGTIFDATSYSINDRSRTSENAFDDSEFCDESVLQLLDKPFSQLVDGMQLRKNDRYQGFDNNAGDSWIYPTNYPVRKYQFTITQAALFKNTLVVLPTGLGKTFIAAVVMYNLYRWYPTGKVIFMAPTRPLVNQQIEACYKIMGIPKEDTAEMTGKQLRKNRSELWQSKRVFYVTPQVVLADINSPEQNFPTDSIKLVVIDEAHKAKGRYAYTEVIKAISATNKQFRVLALSATPGRTLEDVAEVLRNLLISHIEVRWENSIDVSPYTFKKNIRTVVIPLGPTLSQIRDRYIELIDPYVRRLMDANVISGHTRNLSSGWLVMEQKRFREACLIQRHPNYTAINSDFSAGMSMYHAMELLVRHGVRAFLNFFEDDSGSKPEEKFFVAKDIRLKAFLDELREEYGRNPLAIFNNVGAPMPNGVVPRISADEKIDFGHPKFAILERHLREHFENHPDSKVIVFCEFRDSVAMIHRLLLQNRPLVKPKCIVGQGGTAGGLRAVTQKEQIAAMRDFRAGLCNTLIATCVAEEGIDVGEVDLIVCFDITKNPTRFVQRIGRTGRQRVGRVLMLVTEGKEHETLKEVLASKDKTNQKLSRSKEILSVLYRNSPRLVPTEFNPKCVETFIKIPEEKEVAPETGKRGRRKRKNSEAEEGEEENEEIPTRTTRKSKRKQADPKLTQDVRNFFRKVETDLDVSERDVFTSPGRKDSSHENSSFLNGSREKHKAPQDTSLRLGKTEQEQELEKLVKPLLRHRGRLERGQFLKARKSLVLREEKVKKSILCPNPLKKMFFEANITHLKDLVEKSEILQVALGDSEDLILLDDRGECVRSELQEVENVFGGRNALKNRVTEIEEMVNVTENNFPKKISKISDQPVNEEQIAKFNDIFKRFSTHKLTRNAKDVSTARNPTPTPPETHEPVDPSVSNLFESQLYLPAIMEPQEASFHPLNLDTSPIRKLPFENTPINNKPKSRAATLAKYEKKTPANYSNSPLLRAFNRSIQKAKYSSPMVANGGNPKSDVGFRMVLEYFGLETLNNIFEEPSQQPVGGNKFLNRLEALIEEDVEGLERSLTEHIPELSKSLFDPKELVLESQEAEFLAKDFSQSIEINKEPEAPKPSLDSTVRREMELLEADFIDGTFSLTMEKSPKQVATKSAATEEIPIEDFLRENFDDDESPVKPTIEPVPSSELFPLSNTSTRQKQLNLDIGECLQDLLEDEPPKENETESEEVIPNSQENAQSVRVSQFKSLKTLHVGNLQDLLADSEDDLFGDSEECKPDVQAKPIDNSDSDKTVDYNLNEHVLTSSASQKENVPIQINKLGTPKSNKEALPSPKCPDKSPSLLRKKLNFTRLRLNRANADTMEINSAPVERISSNGGSAAAVQSPFFASCRPAENARSFLDDTAIIAPRAKRKAVIESDSEEEDRPVLSKPTMESSEEEDEAFQTARTSIVTSKMGPPKMLAPSSKRIGSGDAISHRKKRRKHCDFFLSQVEVSDDDEEEDDFEEDELSHMVDDSIVFHGHVEDDSNVDMRAKYLQSVRSPVHQGRFKIPAAPTRFLNTLDIYSQPSDRYEQQGSNYEECSFVVPEDEIESQEDGSESDELERAERILRERRRAKKLGLDVEAAAKKRRRKIVSLANSDQSSSSDSEGEEMKAFRKRIRSMPD